MKKILFVFTMLLAMVTCTNKPATVVESNGESSEVAFDVAKNYFFKNGRSSESHPSLLEDGRVTDEGKIK